MTMSRYILEPYKTPKSRFDCPSCMSKKTFVRYIDTDTGEHLAPHVGRCNRENNCAYHYTPKQYFQANNLHPTPSSNRPLTKPQKPASFIPKELFETSIKAGRGNHFLTYLNAIFGEAETDKLRCKYFLSTSKRWEGAVIFWQIDQQLRIRTGKIMQYNPTTGKRIKTEQPTWVHKYTGQPDFELRQCFFGEHLLRGTSRQTPIAIVESEKTAVISSAYFPQFVWLASSGKNGLSAEKCDLLSGRNVTLFPDLMAFDEWNIKAEQHRFKISNLLERNATIAEKSDSLDLADYLCAFDYREFRKLNNQS